MLANIASLLNLVWISGLGSFTDTEPTFSFEYTFPELHNYDITEKLKLIFKSFNINFRNIQ